MMGLFRKRRPLEETPRFLPDGKRIYAIGDIHGRIDLLDDLIARIDADDAARPPADVEWIVLGDLIDRGPNSAEVVERLLTLSETRGNIRFILGNHEEVFLQAMHGDLEALRLFARIGGRETIVSYGVSEHDFERSDYDELFDLLNARVPARHLAFLDAFERMIERGDYAFVHAGIRPGVALTSQSGSDLRWIRSSFLNHEGEFGAMVVHGHTISDDVEIRHNRIGIDTGAYASGRLTALGLEGGERWFLATEDDRAAAAA